MEERKNEGWMVEGKTARKRAQRRSGNKKREEEGMKNVRT